MYVQHVGWKKVEEAEEVEEVEISEFPEGLRIRIGLKPPEQMLVSPGLKPGVTDNNQWCFLITGINCPGLQAGDQKDPQGKGFSPIKESFGS
jgi:hypothetical protein